MLFSPTDSPVEAMNITDRTGRDKRQQGKQKKLLSFNNYDFLKDNSCLRGLHVFIFSRHISNNDQNMLKTDHLTYYKETFTEDLSFTNRHIIVKPCEMVNINIIIPYCRLKALLSS